MHLFPKFEEKKLLFLMKTGMADIKIWYKNLHKNDMSCRICFFQEENLEHLISCKPIISFGNLESDVKNLGLEDIHSTLPQQMFSVKVWRKIFKTRDRILETRASPLPKGSQVTPSAGSPVD